jgi:4-amino-4-deoxy-L-arabinose transferase-like glycosyltransferase
MHKAWMMKEGTVSWIHPPFPHNPMLEWLIIPFMSLTGESAAIIRVMRLVMLLVSFASLWIFWRIGKEVLAGETQALLAVILLLGSRPWAYKSIEIRPDNLMILFALLSFWALVRYARDPSWRRVLLVGVFAGLSFLGKQTAFVFCVPVALILAYDAVLVRKLVSWKLVLAGAAVLAVLAQVEPLKGFLAAHAAYLVPGPHRFPASKFLLKALVFNPLVCALFVVQFFRPHRLSEAGRPLEKYMVAIALFALAVLIQMNRPFAQEQLLMAVFMSLLASGLCADIAAKRSWKAGCWLVLLLAGPAFVVMPMNAREKSMNEAVEITRTILKISDRNDLVFDAYGRAIFRHHPLEPKFLVYLPRSFHRLEQLKKKDVKFVIWDKIYAPQLSRPIRRWVDRNYDPLPENTNILVRVTPP